MGKLGCVYGSLSGADLSVSSFPFLTVLGKTPCPHVVLFYSSTPSTSVSGSEWWKSGKALRLEPSSSALEELQSLSSLEITAEGLCFVSASGQVKMPSCI